jgi:hypothetical protein
MRTTLLDNQWKGETTMTEGVVQHVDFEQLSLEGQLHYIEQVRHTKIHLFVTIPNNSGSTLVLNMLSGAPGVSALPIEGQWLSNAIPNPVALGCGRVYTVAADHFRNEALYNWKRIEVDWYLHWSKKPEAPVLVEKSPPNVIRAEMMQQYFPNARFVLSIRDPYAFVSSVRNHRNLPPALIARHWLECAKYQVHNRNVLKHHVSFRYEDLCNSPDLVCDKIRALVPELGPLAMPSSLKNPNDERKGALTLADLEAINSVLYPHRDLLRYFGYNLHQIQLI